MTPTVASLFSLAGKTLLLTGATGGIGRTLALALGRAGASLAIHGQTEVKVAALCQELEGAGTRTLPLSGDLSRVESCRAVVEAAVRRLGRLDILVNCAGVNRRKPAREVTEEDWDWIIGVNLKSVFFLCQAAHARMKEQGGGKILNVGSITSTEGLGGVSVYGVTKAAVWQMTRTLALEWARDQVLVNCLAPGFIFTPLTEKGLWGDPHRSEWLKNRIPLGRPGRPDELIGAALLLLSPASSYMTGQIINVDGGYLAGGSWLRENE